MRKIKAIVIGTGGFARLSIKQMLGARGSTKIVGFLEPSEDSRKATRAFIEKLGHRVPPYYGTLEELMAAEGKPDMAYIITPHKFHFPWIRDCFAAGIDVLVEKPMVMNAKEAKEVIKLRDKHQRILVVGFPGSLSPAMTKAKQLLAKGAIGPVQGVAGFVHQNWKTFTHGAWRQVPEISGGGFLFDTGSHMINTTVDLIGSDVRALHAELDSCGTKVEINSTISGVFRNGMPFSFLAIGDSSSCRGDIRVVGRDGILEIGIWGQYLKIQLPKNQFAPVPVSCGKPKTTWQNFVDVYRGKRENPCPAEVGLRFARFMDLVNRHDVK